MLWNYRDDDVETEARMLDVSVSGLPKDKRILLRHYRIDQSHSNAFEAWRRMGSPERPTAAQQAALEASGQLETIGSPEWIDTEDGEVRVRFLLPSEAISLLEFSW